MTSSILVQEDLLWCMNDHLGETEYGKCLEETLLTHDLWRQFCLYLGMSYKHWRQLSKGIAHASFSPSISIELILSGCIRCQRDLWISVIQSLLLDIALVLLPLHWSLQNHILVHISERNDTTPIEKQIILILRHKNGCGCYFHGCRELNPHHTVRLLINSIRYAVLQKSCSVVRNIIRNNLNQYLLTDLSTICLQYL